MSAETTLSVHLDHDGNVLAKITNADTDLTIALSPDAADKLAAQLSAAADRGRAVHDLFDDVEAILNP